MYNTSSEVTFRKLFAKRVARHICPYLGFNLLRARSRVLSNASRTISVENGNSGSSNSVRLEPWTMVLCKNENAVYYTVSVKTWHGVYSDIKIQCSSSRNSACISDIYR